MIRQILEYTDIEQKLIDLLGTTPDIDNAMYILPDGTMVKRNYNMSHSEIAVNIGIKGGHWKSVSRLLVQHNIVRVATDSRLLHLSTGMRITKEQLDVLIAQCEGRNISIDMVKSNIDPDGYEDMVLAWHDRYTIEEFERFIEDKLT